MMHTKRRWKPEEIESAEILAQMLTQRTWTLCSAFMVKGYPRYLFLNDATGEDAAAEFAVVRRLDDDGFLQIESITFSWCDEGRALLYIREVLAGEYDRVD